MEEPLTPADARRLIRVIVGCYRLEAMNASARMRSRRHQEDAKTMKCQQCGTAMKTRRENFSYTASGLQGVTLVGVEVSRCPGCGEFEVSIPRIEQLHRALARFVIQKDTPFTGAEVRFLRKFLGWSGADFAKHIGVTPESVSRWEQDREIMSPPADRALRLMVATREPVTEYPLGKLKDILRRKPKAVRVRVRVAAHDWKAEAAGGTK